MALGKVETGQEDISEEHKVKPFREKITDTVSPVGLHWRFRIPPQLVWAYGECPKHNYILAVFLRGFKFSSPTWIHWDAVMTFCCLVVWWCWVLYFYFLSYFILCHLMLFHLFAFFFGHRARVFAPNETALVSRVLLKSNKDIGTMATWWSRIETLVPGKSLGGEMSPIISVPQNSH